MLGQVCVPIASHEEKEDIQNPFAAVDEPNNNNHHPCLVVAQTVNGDVCTVLSISTGLLNDYLSSDLMSISSSSSSSQQHLVGQVVCQDVWVTLDFQPNVGHIQPAPTPSTIWLWGIRSQIIHSTFLETCLAHHVWPAVREIETHATYGCNQLRLRLDFYLLRPNQFLTLPFAAQPRLLKEKNVTDHKKHNGKTLSNYTERVNQAAWIQKQETTVCSMLEKTCRRCETDMEQQQHIYFIPSTRNVLWAQSQAVWDVRGGVMLQPNGSAFPNTLLLHIVDKATASTAVDEEEEGDKSLMLLEQGGGGGGGEEKRKKRKRKREGEGNDDDDDDDDDMMTRVVDDDIHHGHQRTLVLSSQKQLNKWAHKAELLFTTAGGFRKALRPLASKVLRLYGHHTRAFVGQLEKHLATFEGIVLTTPGRWTKNKTSLVPIKWSRVVVDNVVDSLFIQRFANEVRTQRAWVVARTASKSWHDDGEARRQTVDVALRHATKMCHMSFSEEQRLPETVHGLIAPPVGFIGSELQSSRHQPNVQQPAAAASPPIVCHWIQKTPVDAAAMDTSSSSSSAGMCCCVCGQAEAVVKVACLRHGLCSACLLRDHKDNNHEAPRGERKMRASKQPDMIRCPNCVTTTASGGDTTKSLISVLPKAFRRMIVCVDKAQAADKVAKYLFNHFTSSGGGDKKETTQIIHVPATNLDIVMQSKRVRAFVDSTSRSILVCSSTLLQHARPESDQVVIVCRNKQDSTVLEVLKNYLRPHDGDNNNQMQCVDVYI